MKNPPVRNFHKMVKDFHLQSDFLIRNNSINAGTILVVLILPFCTLACRFCTIFVAAPSSQGRRRAFLGTTPTDCCFPVQVPRFLSHDMLSPSRRPSLLVASTAQQLELGLSVKFET